MEQQAGWYPDPQHHAEYRWWDGIRWTDQVADGGIPHADGTGVPAPAAAGSGPAAGSAGLAGATGLVAGLAPGGWQVVVGPALPSFGALAAAGGRLGPVGRVLGRPAVATGVAAAASILPALVSDVDDVQAFLPLRIGVSVVAVVVAAVAAHLPPRLRPVAVVAPLLFALVQGAAAVPVIGGLQDDVLGLATALPFLVSAVASVVIGVRSAVVARRAGRQARATS